MMMIFVLSLLLSLAAATPFDNQPRQGNKTCPFAEELSVPTHGISDRDTDCGGLVTSLSTFNETFNGETFLIRRIVHVGRRNEAICFDTGVIDGDQVTLLEKIKIKPVRSKHSIDVVAESWRSTNLKIYSSEVMYTKFDQNDEQDMRRELKELSQAISGNSVVYGRFYRFSDHAAGFDTVGRLALNREGYCVRLLKTGYKLETTITYDYYINGSFVGDVQVETVSVLPSPDILKSASVTYATMTEYQGELTNQILFIDDEDKKIYQGTNAMNGPYSTNRNLAFWAPCHMTPDELHDKAENWRWYDKDRPWGGSYPPRLSNKINYDLSMISDHRNPVQWKNRFDGELVVSDGTLKVDNYMAASFTTVISVKAKVLTVRRVMGVITDFECFDEGSKLDMKVVCEIKDVSVVGNAMLFMYQKDSCASISRASFYATKNARASLVVPQLTGDYHVSICTQFGRCVDHYIKVDKTIPPPPPFNPGPAPKDPIARKSFWSNIGYLFAGIFQSVLQTLIFVAIIIGVIVLIVLVVRMGLCCSSCCPSRRRRKQEEIELQTK